MSLSSFRALLPHGAGWGSVVAVSTLHSPLPATIAAGIAVSTWAWVLQRIGDRLFARLVTVEQRQRANERRIADLDGQLAIAAIDHEHLQSQISELAARACPWPTPEGHARCAGCLAPPVRPDGRCEGCPRR